MNTTDTDKKEASAVIQPPRFANPYEGCPTVMRINADADINDYRKLQSISPARGTLQTTVNLLFNKLLNELEARNISDFTQQHEFERFVAECRLVTPAELSLVARGNPLPEVAPVRQPTPRPSENSAAPTHGGGTAHPSGENSETSAKPTSVEDSNSGGGRRATGTSKGTEASRKRGKAGK